MKVVDSHHALATRKPKEEIFAETQRINEISYLNQILNAMPNIAAITNKERQILYYNKALLNFANSEKKGLYGLRLGEVLNCIHSEEMKAGCGTSESCRYCGAINATLKSQELNAEVVEDCRISSINVQGNVSYDLRITANPFFYKDETYTVLGIEDISSDNRRRNLERIFFHDVINTAGGIQGFIGFLKDAQSEDEMKEYIGIAHRLSHDLVDEIQAHRALTAAENQELIVNTNELSVHTLLNDVVNSISFHQVAEDKNVVIDKDAIDQSFISDEVILKRVIVNMTKNALEASTESMTVTLGCDKEDGYLSMWVKNESHMPRSVQLQVFQRSFSTKGSDRGLGTYSIKLLTEKFLKGKVSFTSTEKEGTIFYAKIPDNK
jgi:K+-sensing histidine kinase KdpD